jgi:hypothetical protein
MSCTFTPKYKILVMSQVNISLCGGEPMTEDIKCYCHPPSLYFPAFLCSLPTSLFFPVSRIRPWMTGMATTQALALHSQNSTVNIKRKFIKVSFKAAVKIAGVASKAMKHMAG